MLRRLFTPRWLGALLLACLWAVASYNLGHWQYGRHLQKVERNERLDAHYAAEPVPVQQVIRSGPLAAESNWTHVTMTGHYRPDDQLYVRNRPNHGVYGYEVVVPFDIDGGGRVLVDRGWVENAKEGADVLPPVPPAPTGEVTVVGWARPGEPALDRRLPAGQIASINPRDAGAATGTPLLDAYVLLDSERTATGATPPRPMPLERPDRSLGVNQAYAFQWWMSMPIGLVLMWFGIRRELRREDPQWRPAQRTVKPMSDEEFEDAL